MKKTIFFLSTISFFALTSCSSDDNSSTDSNASTDVLVKKIIHTQEDEDGFNDIITYTYDGKKLREANYLDGTKEKYYYSGDLITKIEYIYDGEVEDQDLFEYDANGKLVKCQLQQLIDNYEEKSTFVYNDNNTITETYTTGNLNNANGLPRVTTLTVENDEISKAVQTSGDTYVYTHDVKNSPFKNVTGYSKIAYAIRGDFELEGRNQNIAKIVNQTGNFNYKVNVYQYNSNNYPTSATSTAIFTRNSEAEVLKVQYFYE